MAETGERRVVSPSSMDEDMTPGTEAMRRHRADMASVETDRTEIWATRIGRLLGLAALAVLAFGLVIFYLR